MRLIDADKLRDDAVTCRETTEAFQGLIDNAENVDAIPVFWLRGMRDLMMLGELSRPFAKMIDNLIRVWYKENNNEQP